MTAYDQNKRFSQRFGPMLFSNGSLANYVQQIFKAFEIIGILKFLEKREKQILRKRNIEKWNRFLPYILIEISVNFTIIIIIIIIVDLKSKCFYLVFCWRFNGT